MPFAALDLGTNTFRLLIAEPSPGRPPWRRLDYAQAIVRLGEGLEGAGTINPEAEKRALAALADFAARIRAHGIAPEAALAVTTAAVREAENGTAFVARVQEQTGLRLRVLSGEEEARLSLAGAAAALPEGIADDWLLADIGGGSTELVHARKTNILFARSLPVGVVKLTERFLRHDPPAAEEIARLRAHLAEILDALPLTRPQALVATAGTPTTLAALALGLSAYDPARVNGFFFAREDWDALAAQVLAATKAERMRHPLVPARRADVLPAGVVLLDEILRRWAPEGFYVSDAGLLEGAWLAAAGRLTPSAS